MRLKTTMGQSIRTSWDDRRSTVQPLPLFVGQERSLISRFTVSIVGDACVGKTSFLRRFRSDVFDLFTYATHGASFEVHSVTLDDRVLQVEICDTGGNMRYRCLTPFIMTYARGFFVLYSVTDETSFHNLPYWLDLIKKHSSEHPRPVVIVGCKADLKDKRVVSFVTAKDFADEVGASFLEISCRDGTNIEWAFFSLLTLVERLPSETGITHQQWCSLQQRK